MITLDSSFMYMWHVTIDFEEYDSAVTERAVTSLLLDPHHLIHHGCRDKSYQREDPLQQSPRLCLLNTYVLTDHS